MAMFPGSDQYPLIPPLQEVIPLGLLPAGNAAITGEIFTVGMGRCTLLCQYAKTLVEPEKGEDYYLGQGVVLTLELSPYALDSQVPAGEAEWWPISVIQPTAVGGCFVNQNMMEPATVIYCGVNRDDTLESWTLDVSLPSHAQRLRVCARELDDSEGAGEGSFGCYALLSGDSGGEFGWTLKGTGSGATEANPVPVEVSEKTLVAVSGTVAATGDVVASPGAGYRIVVSSFTIQNEVATAQTVQLHAEGTATEGFRLFTPADAAGYGLRMTFPAGREWRLGEDEDLEVTLSAATTVGFSVHYFVEAV